ncbi:MAG: hypothetical protein IKO03_13365 [Lachnospiraceae bacterium]|nr:hypothetical protein [Lachnospiraceae bacterium]MBR3509744.1 hypothetical protein [Lachnospiraceae bacterium]MBR4606778.1 hypothetical protein [Lachnospiraceae bacterium]MBR6150152.1 hypothetical protein [Lachnospiraceae bacterium]
MIQGLSQLYFLVQTDATIDFYRGLGFQEIARKRNIYDQTITMEGYGLKLIFYVNKLRPKHDLHPEHVGIRYFTLQVDHIEEFAEKFGVPVLDEMNGDKICLLEDPERMRIELREPRAV